MFDALEARLNSAVMRKLANASAAIGANPAVPVIFDAEYQQGMTGVVGMGAASPQMYISTADVPENFIGQQVVVNGATWNVAESHPDGDVPTGLTLVLLEKP